MRLFLKLAVVALALGVMALGLLALRQQRYETSSELSKAHWRILEQERAIWRLRAEIARNSRPQDIRQAAERLHLPLEPIPNRVAPVAATAAERDATRAATGG